MKVECYGGDGMVSNCYLTVSDCGKYAAVIDPSVSYETVFRQRGAMPTVKAILLTHAHFDHMLELSSWRDATRAPLCLMYHDAQSISNADKTLFRFMGMSPEFETAERPLSDGDEIEIGDITFTVIHTPGHTPGSCVYMCDNVMFCGDTLFRTSVGRTDFPGGSTADLVRSLQKIASLRGDYVLYSGHGESSTLEFERKFNPYLRK